MSKWSDRRACGTVVLAGLLAGMLWVPGARAKDTPVTGVVFVDKNGDGKLSPDEQGLSGAVISDGVNVYKTDAAGRFSFTAVTDAMFGEAALPLVFLSMPDGYRGTTPWFIRLGEPGQQLQFGITAQPQPRPFEFIHVTDIHALPQGGPQWSGFAQEMNQATDRYRFIVDTGDIGDLPNTLPPARAMPQLEAAQRMFQSIPIPAYHTAGNHDVMAGAALRAGWQADSPDFGYDAFCRLFGPSRWSFTYGGVHFVGVDTVARDGGMGKPYGEQWLAKDLAAIPADMPVYLFGHHFAGWEKVLRQRPIRYAFYGHIHDDEITQQNGVTLVQSGSLGRCHQRDRREGYRVVRVESDGSIQSIYRFVGAERCVVLDPPTRPEITGDTLDISACAYGLPAGEGHASYDLSGIRGECLVESRPLGLALSAKLTAASLPCGYHKLTITADRGNATATAESLLLKRTGSNPQYTGGSVKLYLAMGGVDTPAHVLVNGREIGQIDKTASGGDKYTAAARWTQLFSFDVPPDCLLRLNTITIKPGNKPGGGADQVFLSYLWMEHDGQVFKDMRQQAYGMYYPFSTDQYIDLNLPFRDPQALRSKAANETAAAK